MISKLLISCDEYVFKYNNRYYLREFGHKLFNRYLTVFDRIQLALRTKEIYSSDDLLEYNIQIQDERIEIIEMPFFQGPKEFAINYLRICKKKRRIGKDCNAALLRIPSTIGFACMSQIKRRKIPYALEIIANPLELKKSTCNGISSIIYSIIHKQQINACKKADGISYVTKHSLQQIYPATKKNCFTSHYSSVDLPDTYYTEARILPTSKKIILCHVSSPIKTYSKGHITVLNITKKLIDDGYDIETRFAGDGELVPVFKQFTQELKIQDSVKFLGKLNQKDLRNLYLESDFLVFPSSTEGLPRVILEGYATGLPCLSSPVGGIPEIVPQDMLFGTNDVNGFAKKIIEVIKNPISYNDLSIIAVEIAKEFSSNNLQKKRVEFYKKLKSSIK